MSKINHSKFILFYLDQDLEIYQGQNPESRLKPLQTLFRERPTLELANRFAEIWADLDKQNYFVGVSVMYFLLGPTAGFTDTRVVTMWLRSWSLFSEAQEYEYFSFKSPESLNLSQITAVELKELLAKTKAGRQEVIYSAEPRIGRK